jgi:hypothetical protein
MPAASTAASQQRERRPFSFLANSHRGGCERDPAVRQPREANRRPTGVARGDIMNTAPTQTENWQRQWSARPSAAHHEIRAAIARVCRTSRTSIRVVNTWLPDAVHYFECPECGCNVHYGSAGSERCQLCQAWMQRRAWYNPYRKLPEAVRASEARRPQRRSPWVWSRRDWEESHRAWHGGFPRVAWRRTAGSRSNRGGSHYDRRTAAEAGTPEVRYENGE